MKRTLDTIVDAQTHARTLGLKPSQLGFLASLELIGKPVRMHEMAGDICCTRGAITGLADRLEAKGLVSRTIDDDDRRGVRVELTEKGRNIVRVIEEAARV